MVNHNILQYISGRYDSLKGTPPLFITMVEHQLTSGTQSTPPSLEQPHNHDPIRAHGISNPLPAKTERADMLADSPDVTIIMPLDQFMDEYVNPSTARSFNTAFPSDIRTKIHKAFQVDIGGTRRRLEEKAVSSTWVIIRSNMRN